MANSSRWPEGFEFLDSESLGPNGYNMPLNSNIVDISRNVVHQLKEFAPYLRLIGFNKITKRKKNPRKLFYRALENQQTNERCLQYLQVYKYQFGIIEKESLILFFLITIHLLLTNSLVLSTLQDLIAIILVTFILGAYLFLFGLIPHIEDYIRGTEKRGRARTVFLPFGFLIGLYGLAPDCILICYILLLVGVFLYFLLEVTDKAHTSHRMDYEPIFVYIKKRIRSNEWEFIKACWDKGHYKVGHTDQHNHDYLKDNKRIMLMIDNLWHDFTPLTLEDDRNFHTRDWNWIQSAINRDRIKRILFSLILPLLLIGLILQLSLIILLDVISIYILGVLCYIGFSELTRSDSKYQVVDLLNRIDLVLQRNHLTHDKLETLWSLSKKKEQLIIRDILQNPFYPNSDHFKKFDADLG